MPSALQFPSYIYTKVEQAVLSGVQCVSIRQSPYCFESWQTYFRLVLCREHRGGRALSRSDWLRVQVHWLSNLAKLWLRVYLA